MDNLSPLKASLNKAKLQRRRLWLAPAIGGLTGLVYGIIEHFLDLEALHSPKIVMAIDELVIFLLPVFLGAIGGIVYNYVQWQESVNWSLSTENAKQQHSILAQLLSSHILHEIRNPLHNLTTGIERWKSQLAPDQSAMLERNIERLHGVTKQLTRWNLLDDTLDLRQPVALRPWLEAFIHDKVRPQLHQQRIYCELDVEDATVNMHALLLEQCFVALFNNALDAVMQDQEPRLIRVHAAISHEQNGFVDITMSNSGSRYPAEVVQKQAREAVESKQGLGLGLVLVRRTVEQLGGTLHLGNLNNQATIVLQIPGTKK